MTTPRIIACLWMLSGLSAAWGNEDVCKNVYGKHRLFHHAKNGSAPEEFSAPLALDLEIKKDGTLVSHYYFDREYAETAVFSREFPQLIYLSRSGGFQRGCKHREPECERLREDVKSYILNSLNYLDITSEEDTSADPRVAVRRKSILKCANALRDQIIASTVR